VERNGGSAQTETIEAIIDEWTLEADPDDEAVVAVDVLAGLEPSLDDTEPWQRLGDILGRIIEMDRAELALSHAPRRLGAD